MRCILICNIYIYIYHIHILALLEVKHASYYLYPELASAVFKRLQPKHLYAAQVAYVGNKYNALPWKEIARTRESAGVFD